MDLQTFGDKMNFKPIDPMQMISSSHNVDRLLAEHNASLLLPDPHVDWFMRLTESECFDALGVPYHDWDEEKGHGKEWYFTAPSGSLVGVAFRWSSARLRGNFSTTTDDVAEFLGYLYQAVKNCPSK